MAVISLVIGAVALATALLALWSARSRKEPVPPGEPDSPVGDPDQAALRQELMAQKSSALGMGKRIRALEAELRWHREKLERLERTEGGDGGRYAQAIRQVAKGASVDELVEDFGLSRSEARLLVTMHQHGQEQDSF